MGMKLAFYSSPFPRIQSYYDMIDVAVEYGLKAIEVFSAFEFSAPNIAAAKELKKYADRNNISFSCVSVYIEFENGNTDEKVEQLKRYADVAKELNCPYLHHTVIAEHQNPDNILPRSDELFALAINVIREVYDYAESIGIKAIYEPQGYLLNGISGIQKLLDTVNRKIGLVADFGNIYQAGDSILDFIKVFSDKILHVHIKDAVITSADSGNNGLKTLNNKIMTEIVPGKGDIPIAEAISLLKKSGYNAYYGLEYSASDDNSTDIDDVISMLGQL